MSVLDESELFVENGFKDVFYLGRFGSGVRLRSHAGCLQNKNKIGSRRS